MNVIMGNIGTLKYVSVVEKKVLVSDNFSIPFRYLFDPKCCVQLNFEDVESVKIYLILDAFSYL